MTYVLEEVNTTMHSNQTTVQEAAAKELAFFFPNFQSETAALERTLCIIRPDTNKQYKV